MTPTNITARIVFDNGQRDTHAIVYNHQWRMFIKTNGSDLLRRFIDAKAS